MDFRVVTELTSRLDTLADNLEPRAARVVKETITEIKDDIETAMRLPKSGVVYGSHQASAPGDAPAVDEGDLIDSLQAEMTGPTAGEVRVDDPKGALLEYGSAGGKIAARPFMTPAANANRQRFNDKMEGIIRG